MSSAFTLDSWNLSEDIEHAMLNGMKYAYKVWILDNSINTIPDEIYDTIRNKVGKLPFIVEYDCWIENTEQCAFHCRLRW